MDIARNKKTNIKQKIYDILPTMVMVLTLTIGTGVLDVSLYLTIVTGLILSEMTEIKNTKRCEERVVSNSLVGFLSVCVFTGVFIYCKKMGMSESEMWVLSVLGSIGAGAPLIYSLIDIKKK